MKKYEKRLFGRKGFKGRKGVMKHRKHNIMTLHEGSPNHINDKMIFYRSPRNVPFPQEYYAPISLRFSGALAAGSASYTLIIRANDCLEPFNTLPAAGITWVDGVTPRTSAMAGWARLANVGLYTKSIVVTSKLRVFCTPSDTASNDSVLVTITPSDTASGSAPTSTSNALQQEGVVWQEFRAFGAKAKPLVKRVDWARFYGITRREYVNDPQLLYGQVYATPVVNANYLVINIATLDAGNTTASLPFTLELTNLVKFCELSAAQFS